MGPPRNYNLQIFRQLFQLVFNVLLIKIFQVYSSKQTSCNPTACAKNAIKLFLTSCNALICTSSNTSFKLYKNYSNGQIKLILGCLLPVSVKCDNKQQYTIKCVTRVRQKYLLFNKRIFLHNNFITFYFL